MVRRTLLRTDIQRSFNRTIEGVAVAYMLDITDSIVIHERDLEERFVRASGPGGQNVNKVSSAVHLRFDIPGSTLPEPVKQRLLALRDQRITQQGVVVIKAQQHRSRVLNQAAALQRLQELVDSVAATPALRRATKPSWGAKQRRLESKSQRSAIKRMRGGSEE